MKLKNNTGSAVVEFAVILPLLLLILYGIIEFGLIFYNKALLTNASREGARFGVLYRAPDDVEARNDLQKGIEDRIDNYLGTKLISFGDHSPTIDFRLVNPETKIESPVSLEDLESDQYLLIRINFDYEFLLIPAFIPGISNIISLAGTTTMRVE